MSIFKTPSDQESFFVPQPGSYIGELKSLEPFAKGKYGPSIRWTWVVFDINTKQPVLFNDAPATVDTLSTTDMSPKSKGRGYANKHLASKETPRVVVEGEDPDALSKELIGLRVKLSYSLVEDDEGKETVKLVSVFAYTG